MDRRHSIASVVGAAALTMATCACADDETQNVVRAADDNVITVGSFDFGESALLAEVYGQALEAGGFDVERAYALGPREFVGPALRNGLIDLVPEYAGTAVDFISRSESQATDDVEETHAQLQAALDGSGITVLDAAPAQNANVFVVTVETAAAFDLETLTDLVPHVADMTFGGPPECASRRLCLGGLREVYGLRFADVLSLDASGPLTRQALRDGHVDVGLMFSTDPALDGDTYVVLEDDRDLQPAENITPLIRTEAVERWGNECTDLIDEVSSHLTTVALRHLNTASGGSTDPATLGPIVEAWLSEVGLT